PQSGTRERRPRHPRMQPLQHSPRRLAPFSSTLPRPPRSTLFPYTTLFRSQLFLRAVYFNLITPQGAAHTRVCVDIAEAVSLAQGDRKSTRLNSSHRTISYAVFCLKKKICGVFSPVPVTGRTTRSSAPKSPR